MLRQLVGWAADNSSFISHLVLDAAAGEPAARRFLRSLAKRHPRLVLRAIAEAQRTGEVRNEEPMHIMMFLMGAMALPIFLAETAGRGGPIPSLFRTALALYARDPQHCERRLDWAMAGIRAETGS
jgi:hypothetical protein